MVDVFDVSKYATDPNVTTPIASKNFGQFQQISDIVAVNGRPAKRTLVLGFRNINIRTAPDPGQAVGDSLANNVMDQTFQIMKPDGTVIGSIMTIGLGNGTTPPGAPSTALLGDSMIIGGTGAFIGVRGQSSAGQVRIANRNASVTEDPANRRRIGGGAARFILTLIPLSRPEVVTNPNVPAVFHGADFSLVTAAKPARASEVLILTATNLGPTSPGLDPGKPFPQSPPQEVNSPVDVTVNGQAPISSTRSDGLASKTCIEWIFEFPMELPRERATLQLTAAWIAGPEIKIAMQ